LTRESEARLYVAARDFVWRGEQLWASLRGPRGTTTVSGLDLGPDGPEARYGKWRVTAGLLSTATGEITSPGEDPTGAGAEREWGFALTPNRQSKAELVQGEYKGAREVPARHVHTAHRPVAGWPVARGGAKDPTDDPAALDVLFSLLMAFGGTYTYNLQTRWGPTSTPAAGD
jgi:hypothetical protein